jgi:chorismate--pyruvate lyase
MMPPSNAAAADPEWLPAERLGQRQVDDGVRPWLIGKGLLTLRLKAAWGERFALRLVAQTSARLTPAQAGRLGTRDRKGLFRDVEMRCGERCGVYARSVIPDSTLSAHPWLSELGDCALGETLSDLSGLERSPYEFAWLSAEDPLTRQALKVAAAEAPGLWARRSLLTLRGAPLLVHELFLPAIGQTAS